METNKIFIDSDAIYKQGIKFEGRVLNKIKELGRSLLIEIYTSVVVKEEISSHILEQLSEAKDGWNQFAGKIENLFESEACKDIPELQELEKRLEGLDKAALLRWENFLKDSGAVVLGPDEICNTELLSLYFEIKPPFSAKKKEEFPDAISMLSLKQKISQSDDSVYVISNDNDLKEFCKNEPNLISLDNLSDFLDKYNSHNELSTAVRDLIDKESKRISECIKEEFKNQDFSYRENYELEFHNMTVDQLMIRAAKVIEIEEGRASIDIDCEISGTAQISGPDYSTAIWDQEDNEYYVFEQFEEVIQYEGFYGVSMELLFDESKDDLLEVDVIDFNDGIPLELWDCRPDEWPYK